MSHALLLRLFLSPYFSISVAMHYLKTYPDSIGISHYLCWRMKAMPAEEVEFYWPQICHLLLTYQTESNALEAFIIQRAEESTHSAMLTFWFMQGALRDLTPMRVQHPKPFAICQRVLHKCHEIIFGDPPEPSRSPYRSLPHSPAASATALASITGMTGMIKSAAAAVVPKLAVKVNPHVPPALVGMGVVLAGAPGMPGLRDLAGEWAVTQGRRPRDEGKEGRARVEVEKGGGADIRPVVRHGSGLRNQVEDESGDSDEEKAAPPSRQATPQPSQHRPGQNPRVQHGGSPNIGNGPFGLHPSSTLPNLVTPHSSVDVRSARSLMPSPTHEPVDPFSQRPQSPLKRPNGVSKHQAHYSSVPDLATPGSSRSNAADRSLPPEVLLSAYSLDAQRQLLRSHYCRSEIRFLLLLEDISNRLLVIPKPARVSALRAELTSVNHNLPAEVCMPMWCAADHSHEEGGETQSSTPLKNRADKPRTEKRRGHSRVVRISPGESVVLNSAERAPYLLYFEILEGDLDFEPSRRENRELLKKIVVQEDMKRRKKELGIVDAADSRSHPQHHGFADGFGAPMPDVVSMSALDTHAREPPRSAADAKASRDQAGPEDMEEMDLVEQLYGDLSVRDKLPDMSDALPYPAGPRNKALDAAAWDRASEGPSRRTSFHAQTPNLGSGPNAGLESALQPPSSGLVPNGLQPPSPAPSAPSTPKLGPGVVPPHMGDAPVLQSHKRVITLEDYSERMRTAAVMLAQLNASQQPAAEAQSSSSSGGVMSWIPGTGWIRGSSANHAGPASSQHAHPLDGSATSGAAGGKLKLAAVQAAAIRERIMEEMMALEDERVARMTDRPEGVGLAPAGGTGESTAEDEGIVRRELNKADPSAAVFSEAWAAKKSRIRASSPWGHLANWDVGRAAEIAKEKSTDKQVISVIVKTGTDLRQEQLATQLIERFSRIFREEKVDCWVRFFRILITGEQSGLVETITDAVSVHSIKKGLYARKIAEGGQMGPVSLMDHFVLTYGKRDTGRFVRAQRNFIRSLAGYSIVTYLLQIKDRHNGNILVDRDGHLIHIDFGFMLSNSPGGNMGFEAAPFKLPLEYVEIIGGLDSPGWQYFKKLFKEGFEAARKHSDSLITIVELMQKNSKLDCFILFGEQTASHLRERFALGLTTAAVDAYLERLILTSTGSNYTRLYDTFQYYSQGVL